MVIHKKEHVTPFDVDDTLVMHNEVLGVDPIEVYCSIENKRIMLYPNHPMVRLLKEEYARGSCVVVWSRGGNAWAASVIKALKLENYVHHVFTKPLVYFDDKDVKEWLPYRVYLEPTTNYKGAKNGI